MEQLQVYEPKRFSCVLEDREFEGEYFLIAFANTTQYGNNAIIAPQADTYDGMMDVVMIKPFPSIHIPVFTIMALFRNLHQSPYVQTFKTPSIVLHNPDAAPNSTCPLILVICITKGVEFDPERSPQKQSFSYFSAVTYRHATLTPCFSQLH